MREDRLLIPVDVLTVVAPGETVEPAILTALEAQGDVELLHRIIEGPKQLSIEFRENAIARARNRAMAYGTSPYVMFLDRDVVLPPRAIETLLFALAANRGYAALGVNYQEEVARPARHVAMGSTLFYRAVLDRITFRTAPGLCECACCCIDIRRRGYAIDYLPGIRARHLRDPCKE